MSSEAIELMMIHVVKLSFIGKWSHARLEFLSSGVLELVGMILVYSGLINIILIKRMVLMGFGVMIHHEVLALVLALVLREERGSELEYFGVNQRLLLLMATMSIQHES